MRSAGHAALTRGVLADRHLRPQTGDWLATVILPLRTQIAGGRCDALGPHRSLEAGADDQEPPVHQDGLSHDRRLERPGAARQAAGGPQQLRDRQGGDRLSQLDDAPARRRALCAPGRRGHARRLRLPPALPLGRPGRAPPEGRLSGRRADDGQPGLWGAVGLAVAVLGAMVLAFAISRPILKIERVVGEVAGGNLEARGCTASGSRTRSATWRGT